MLKLVKRPKSPNWVMRGTVRGVSVEESTGVADRKAAEEILTNRQAEILKESVWGKTATITFAHAVADYLEHGAGNKRFLEPLLKHFRTTLLREIDQHAIDLAAKKLYPQAGPATRNRQVFTPASAVLRHAARKGWCATPTLARPKQPKGIVRWLKPDEAERLIEASARHLRPLVIFLLGTGARVGEALWLDWANVDLDNRAFTRRSRAPAGARASPTSGSMTVGTRGRRGTIRPTVISPRYRPSAAGKPFLWSSATPTRMSRSTPRASKTCLGENLGRAFRK